MDFRLYDDFAGEIEPEWNDLLAVSATHVPFLRTEYLKTWWQTRGGGEWPADAQLAILTARQNERLVGLAPLFLANWENQPTLLLLGSIEISDYLDLVARPEDLPSFCEAMLGFLSDPSSGLPPFARLDFYNVLESSPTLPALRSAAQSAGWEYHQETFRPSLTINLPGDWDTYLSGIDKKQRHEIRRKMRRAEASDASVRWYMVSNAATLDAEIDSFLHLMELDTEKARFLTPPMRETFRSTIHCAFEVGCLQLAFLEIDGVKAAGYFNFDYLDQVWVYNSGMDTSYNSYSPGWVLLGELLKWANEKGRKTFDFMRGDEDYKIRFGATQRDVMRLTVTKKGQG